LTERAIVFVDLSTALALTMQAGQTILILSTLPLAVAVTTALFGNIVQVGVNVSMEPIKAKMSHLNPVQGLKRIFSMRSVVQLVFMLLKTAVVGIAVTAVLVVVVPDAIRIIFGNLGAALAVANSALLQMALWCGGIFVLLGLLDLIYQKFQFIKEQKMTLFELKRELKESEGDPLMKAVRKELAGEPTVRELLDYVGRCSIIVCEPGRRAIAIFHRPPATPAPMVVVRGSGSDALAIIERAQAGKVRVVEDAVLVGQLYDRALSGVHLTGPDYEQVMWLLNAGAANK
jgi:flagellar biosynthetic protein FlhB